LLQSTTLQRGTPTASTTQPIAPAPSAVQQLARTPLTEQPPGIAVPPPPLMQILVAGSN
jgi:hypothetical protein